MHTPKKQDEHLSKRCDGRHGDKVGIEQNPECSGRYSDCRLPGSRGLKDPQQQAARKEETRTTVWLSQRTVLCHPN
jgi:hypothetical protein